MPTPSPTPSRRVASARAHANTTATPHIVDTARRYAALARAHGWSASEVAQRHGRSKGYGSMLLRVGRALAPLSDAEVALFRTPRVTLLEISRRLRRDLDDAAILRMLLSLALTEVPDGRRKRSGRTLPPTLRPARRTRGAHTWVWNEAEAARDPAGAVLQWLEHVRRSERELASHLRALLSRGAPAMASTLRTHDMPGLASAVARSPAAAAPDDARTVEALRQLDQWVAMARAIERVLGGAPPVDAPVPAPAGGFIPLDRATRPDLADALNDDMR